MKIISFTIGDYRVLRDFRLDFARGGDSPSKLQPGYTLDFLAGVNGTGKSTVLQLISRLFAWLETRAWFPIPIELKYVMKDGMQVHVSNLPDDRAEGESPKPFEPQLRITISKDGTAHPEVMQKLSEAYLPRQVVTYTSGSEIPWHQMLPLDQGEAQFEVESPGGDPYALPGWLPGRPSQREETALDFATRSLFVTADRLPLVALCGLLASRLYAEQPDQTDDHRAEILHSVLKSLDIAEFTSFSIRCRVHEGLIAVPQHETIDALEKAATHRDVQGADRLLVFDVADLVKKAISSEGSIFNQPLQLFKDLNALYEHEPYQDSPLQEVNLFLRRRWAGADESPPTLQLWDWLSDGERSFLARMSLFALFREDDILILLDEPEVHFNDVWKRQIVHMLHQIMEDCDSHALITTHSSIALTDVSKEDILVFRRAGEYTVNVPTMPVIQTLAADPSDIIVHVFGTGHPSGERGIRYVQDGMSRAGNNIDDLQDLKQHIAPGYWRYRVQLQIEQIERKRMQG